MHWSGAVGVGASVVRNRPVVGGPTGRPTSWVLATHEDDGLEGLANVSAPDHTGRRVGFCTSGRRNGSCFYESAATWTLPPPLLLTVAHGCQWQAWAMGSHTCTRAASTAQSAHPPSAMDRLGLVTVQNLQTRPSPDLETLGTVLPGRSPCCRGRRSSTFGCWLTTPLQRRSS